MGDPNDLYPVHWQDLWEKVEGGDEFPSLKKYLADHEDFPIDPPIDLFDLEEYLFAQDGTPEDIPLPSDLWLDAVERMLRVFDKKED
jgi:hypothetical protein